MQMFTFTRNSPPFAVARLCQMTRASIQRPSPTANYNEEVVTGKVLQRQINSTEQQPAATAQHSTTVTSH